MPLYLPALSLLCLGSASALVPPSLPPSLRLRRRLPRLAVASPAPPDTPVVEDRLSPSGVTELFDNFAESFDGVS